MIKRLLNLHTITKITLILTTLLLLPQTTLAEDNEYGITVGGVPVTSENASNVLGDETISVSFTPATADNSNNILTLNGAVISSEAKPVIESNLQNLVIKLIGTGNRLECGGDYSIIYSTNANGFLSITDDNSGDAASLILATKGTVSVISGFENMACTLTAYVTNSDFQPLKEMANVAYDTENKVLKANSSNITSVYYSNQPISYGLTVAGTTVTSSNASNIIVNVENDGKVSFDPETNTLTLNGATLNDNIISNLSELTIDVQGINRITTNGKPCITSTVGTFSPTLTIKSTSEQRGGLTLKNTLAEDNCGGVLTRLSVTIDPSIEMILPTQGTGCLTMDSTHIATFGEDYHISIGGVRLTNINISDITQDGKINYNSPKRTLTLNGATIEGGIEWESSQDFMISFDGENNISNTSDAVIKTSVVDIQPTLTFAKAEGASNCKLTLTTGSSSYYVIRGFNENYDGLYSISEYDDDSQTTTIVSSIFSGGNGTEDNPFVINSKEDLSNFSAYMNSRKSINEEISSSYYILNQNIDCSGLTDYDPIDGDDRPFVGTFDGKGNTISNLTYTTSSLGNVGLFADLRSGGTIKNLTLSGCNFTGGQYAAAIAGYSEGNISDCNVENCNIITGNAQTSIAGGIAGIIYGGTIERCTVSGSTIKAHPNWDDPETISGNNGAAYAGGIAGEINSNGKVSSCVVENTNIFTSHPNSIDKLYAAGIVGHCSEENTISGNKVKGTTKTSSEDKSTTSSGNACAAAIIGSKGSATLSNNTYEYTVTAETKNASDSEATVKSKYNHRGMGTAVDDDFDLFENKGAVLADYYQVTLPTPANGEVWLPDYYSPSKSNDDIRYIVAGQEAVVGVNPSSDYAVKTFTVTNTETNATISTRIDNEVIGDGIAAYIFTMPKADVSIEASFGVDISDEEHFISAAIADATYTGEAQIPTSVTLTEVNPESSETTTVTLGSTDFTIAGYKLGDTTVESPINAGTYTVTITGAGNYIGTREVSYTIKKASIQSSQITAPVAKENLIYNGENQDLVTAGSAPTGATMKYSLDANATEDNWTATVPKGKNVGTYNIYYKVDGGNNYENIAAIETPISVNITKATITPTVTLEGWTYGATANTPSVTGNTGNGEVTYAYKLQNAAEDAYTATKPTNAGAYTVKASIAATDNYEAATDSAHFAITKATITPTVTLEGWTYGTTANTPSVTGNTGNGEVTYTYKAAGAEAFTTEAPEVVGTHIVKATIAETANHNGAETTATFTIAAASMTVTAEGYSGAYDGKGHGITVTAAEGAKVMYGTQKDTYNLEASPTYTDAGTYKVYYQVTQENYNTIADSATVNIAKANITPTVTLEGWTYGTTANTPSVTGNTGNGEVTYTYKAAGAETFTTEVPVAVGTHTVKATIAETANYNSAEAIATFTISAASMTITAEGYSGTYDGKAHGIAVTAAEGAKVMYGTKKDTYDLEASPTYTDAGTYKVYYQVTQENYNTIADSATVNIAKAVGGLTYSAATASAELNGDGWTAPELQNPNNLTVTYTSSNTAVATISETGAVTLAGIGETTIKAASAGDANHEASEAQYVLTVSRGKAKGYGIWIGETEVDEDNKDDILGDEGTGEEGKERVAPSFMFNPDDNTLLVIGSDEGLTIESRIPELKIHLSQDNKLKKIFYNNQGNSENTGTLLFTCDSNFPGTATIGNTAGESAITGFASVSYEFNLTTLAPEKAKYVNGQMTDSLGVAADTITVGTPLKPLQGDENETLNPDDFTVTNPDGSTATVDLTSANVNNILYTLPEGTDGQGYDPETNTICVVDPMTDEDVEKIAATTTNNTTTVGSSDYAENFVGLTFIIQGGEGVIKIDQEAEEGYEFHLKIGDDPSITLNSGKEEISYNLPDATYCWLYLVRKAAAARRIDGTRVGKRDRSPGSIRSVKVQPASVKASKSASEASGGKITEATNETITGIVEIKNETTDSRISIETTSNKWYTIDGRQINKPTQKGLYIRNRKKYVVK